MSGTGPKETNFPSCFLSPRDILCREQFSLIEEAAFMGCNSPDQSPTHWGKKQPSRRRLAKIMGLGVVGSIFNKSLAGNLWGAEKGIASETASSIQLHIYIEVKAGKGPELEKLFHAA